MISESQTPFRSNTFTVLQFFREANKTGSLNFSIISVAFCIV